MRVIASALRAWSGAAAPAFGPGSQNRRILSAAVTVAAATLAVKLVAMPKEVLVAYRYGVGDALDAFLVAYLIPSFAINVVGDSFNAAFIPTFVRVREERGHAAAVALFGEVALVSLVILLVVATLLGVTAPAFMPWIGGGFDAGKLALTLELFDWLLPVTVIHGLVVLCAAVLNASGRFGLAALTPAATPLAVIAFIAAGGADASIRLVAWATLCGTLAELVLLVVALHRRGIALRPAWRGWNEPLRKVMAQYVPMVVAAFAMCSSYVVDQSMAAWLDPGSVAALSFGSKVPTLMTSIGAIAIGSAVLPTFAQMVARHDLRAVRHTLRVYLVLIVAVSLPVALVACASSRAIVELLFERGAFVASDTVLVARVQAFYFLMFPSYLVCILGVRLLSAMSKNHLLAIGSTINFIVNVVGNLLLMRVFGVAGIALSTAIVYLVSAAFIHGCLRLVLAQAAKDAPLDAGDP